ncbi:MAG: hypothetical protein ACRD2L_01570 [Terriglobia bacterium]
MRTKLVQLGDTRLTVRGRVVSVARVADEWIDPLTSPVEIAKSLKAVRAGIDLFTFVNHLPPPESFHPYHQEEENLAAISVTTYEHWLTKQIDPKARNHFRKSEKAGLQVRVVQFDDNLVRSIMEIYNETPNRQGRPFWHYGKSFDVVKAELADRIHRSAFLGAYDGGNRLIGFIKLVYGDVWASIELIVSLIAERKKSPNNALIAAAVRQCEEQKKDFLTYAHFSYGQKGVDSLTEFKQDNGFKKVVLPRYWVPLTTLGTLALRLGLHRPASTWIPAPIYKSLVWIRKRCFAS